MSQDIISMAYYESKRLIWSTKEFSLKEIIEKYSEYLPFLVVITQGYSCSRLEIAADQVRICCFSLLQVNILRVQVNIYIYIYI